MPVLSRASESLERISFGAGLTIILGIATVLRVVMAVSQRNVPLGVSDQLWFLAQAKQLVDGEWFVEPVLTEFCGEALGGAQHPPGFTVALAGPVALGFDSEFSARMTACLVGVLVVAAIAIVGRRVAGPRAGLAAALIAALYPTFWSIEVLALSEPLYVLFVVVAMGLTWELILRPSGRVALALGLVLAAATLTRSEGLMLFVLLPLPILWRMVRTDRSAAGRLLLSIAVGGGLLLGPWVAFNLSRFDETVLLGNGLGITLDGANCDDTYPSGVVPGWWTVACLPTYAVVGEGEVALVEEPAPDTGACDVYLAVDESVRERLRREHALDYIGDHIDEVPEVVAIRVGRMWNLYRPWQTARIRELEGGGPVLAPALAPFLVLPVGMAGTMMMHRRRRSIAPVVAVTVAVTITAGLVYGHQRFRLPADAGLIIFAGAALDALMTRVGARPQR